MHSALQAVPIKSNAEETQAFWKAYIDSRPSTGDVGMTKMMSVIALAVSLLGSLGHKAFTRHISRKRDVQSRE
jgi:hypothetical protein